MACGSGLKIALEEVRSQNKMLHDLSEALRSEKNAVTDSVMQVTAKKASK